MPRDFSRIAASASAVSSFSAGRVALAASIVVRQPLGERSTMHCRTIVLKPMSLPPTVRKTASVCGVTDSTWGAAVSWQLTVAVSCRPAGALLVTVCS